jgi:predicted alpha/beta hydrolase family esterase
MVSSGEPRVGVDPTRWEAEADDIVRRLPEPPIVIGHGTAVVFAARTAARHAAPALVAIAPVVSPVDSPHLGAMLRWPQYSLARIGGRRVAPPRGRGRAMFLGAVGAAGDMALVSDSAPIFRALADGTLRLPTASTYPGLVISAARDAISPPDAAADLAARYGWEHRVYPSRGHLAVVEPGWEAIADDIHRWLIRTLGASLLAFLDEDDDER